MTAGSAAAYRDAVLEPEISDDYQDPRLAVFYDQFNGWGADRDFYLDLVMSAPSVLDVGCGTGAILKRARERGHTGRLVGLDPADAMLDHARSRTDIDWVHGDLAALPAAWEFDLVIMTGHVFQVFLTDDQIAAALAAIRAALSRSGRLVFETLNPLPRPWEGWLGSFDGAAPDGTPVTGANAEVHSRPNGIVHVIGRFSSPAWERDIVCPSDFRFTTAAEVDAALDAAGLAVAERYGTWERGRFTDESAEIITIAEVR